MNRQHWNGKAGCLYGLHTALVAGLMLGKAAAAQEVMPAADGQVTELDAVKVSAPTGSRIVRDGYDAPTPVTVATIDQLQAATPSGIPDGLNKLPQFQLSSSPSRSSHNFANAPAHGNILNLRGVGGNRSLILFDGIRMPPTTYTGTVDVDVLPTALLSRVDVVTAGASAAYGSDAVAGVVNFVLDRGFAGVRAHAQYGVSSRHDAANTRIGFAGGWRLFADHAGHLLVSAEYADQDGLLRGDRDSGRHGYNFVGSVPGGGTPGTATNPYIIARDVRTNSASDGGLIVGGPLAGGRFAPGGVVVPFNPGTPTGTAGLATGSDGFIITPDVTTLAPNTSQKLFARMNYDFASGASAWVQGNIARNELSYLSLANSMVAPAVNVVVHLDNPFLSLTDAQRAQMIAAGADTLAVSAFNAYAPKPEARERTDLTMFSAGVEGRWGHDGLWQIALTHADSRHQMHQSGVSNWRQAYAAIDAVRTDDGQIVCRATLNPDPVIRSRYADCQPLNVLGDGAMLTTPEGYRYATGTSHYRADIAHDAVTASLSAVLAELPAGPLDLVFGAEYRRQRLALTSNADPALLATPQQRAEWFEGLRGVSPSALFYALTNVGSANGSISVRETFAELNIPLLAERRWAHALELNMAARVTDYSTSGTVETWKLGSTWRPSAGLLLRATRSRDIRAPSLFDLYAGPQGNLGRIIDPVSNRSDVVAQFAVGNPALNPEIANTLALGAVFSPTAWPGLRFSVDYYRLRIADAIGSLSAGQVIQNCSASGNTAPECAQIVRPAPGEFPTMVQMLPQNVAFLQTSGVDLDASYRTRLGDGTLAVRLYTSWLEHFKQQQSATAPVLQYAGRGVHTATPWARPRWRGNLGFDYALGDFAVMLSGQLIGGFRLGSEEPNQIYLDARINPVWYADAGVRYRPGRMEFSLTFNNLFDRDPPLIPGTTPGVNLPTIISVYDTIGRTITAGMRFEF